MGSGDDHASSPAEVDSDIYDSPERRALRHQQKAPRIGERTALANALKAQANAVRIAVASPIGPKGHF